MLIEQNQSVSVSRIVSAVSKTDGEDDLPRV